MEFERILTVSELSRYIKAVLETDPELRQVWVRGEISNFKHHSSGHMYFTLKDENAQIRAVMFRSANRRLVFRPENGMQVTARGYVGVYERDGAYQLYAEALEPEGTGALHTAFEQLKAKLAAEGLFDAGRKRPLPVLPRRVGIVTSLTGAVLRDIIRVTRRRFPAMPLVVAPAAVQGEEAPFEIVNALNLLAACGGVDVIIVGRGGGSLEDLWAFNDERVARAIAAAPVPVVSAVGHETDFTIADFVADVRAPTPSAAAEIVVPSRVELTGTVATCSIRLLQALRRRHADARQRLRRLVDERMFRRPLDRINQYGQRLDSAVRRAEIAVERKVQSRRQLLARVAGRLDALSPLSVLQRGYGIVQRQADGKLVRSITALTVGDMITVRLTDGQAAATVSQLKSLPQPQLSGREDGDV